MPQEDAVTLPFTVLFPYLDIVYNDSYIVQKIFRNR